jgi:hypothetical protein
MMKRPQEVAPAIRKTLLIATLSLTTGLATGQTVYRCGSTYSQTPCGVGVIIEAEDGRTPEQRAQSDESRKRQAELAQSLEQERLTQERIAYEERVAAAQAATRTAQQKKHPAEARRAHAKTTKHKEPEYFVVPGTPIRRHAPKGN